MCWFISIKSHPAAFAVGRTACGRDWGLRAMLIGGDPDRDRSVTWAVTDGHCSCSFFRPVINEEECRDELAHREARYRKRGWSESKIARALRDAERMTTVDPNPGINECAASVIKQAIAVDPRLQILVVNLRGSVDVIPGMFDRCRRESLRGLAPQAWPKSVHEDVVYCGPFAT